MGRNAIDLTGKVFGKLKVIKRVGNSKYGYAQWLEEKYKCYSEDEREFIKSLFEGTCAGEIIKLIEKETTKKTKKKTKVVKVEGEQPVPTTTT